MNGFFLLPLVGFFLLVIMLFMSPTRIGGGREGGGMTGGVGGEYGGE